MGLVGTPRPEWLTFDCYGTLIQWDEGLVAALRRILDRRGATALDPGELIRVYDRAEAEREQATPFRRFDAIAAESLGVVMRQVGLEPEGQDVAEWIDAIPAMVPFSEVPPTLRALKGAGFRLGIISNTTDRLIADSVARLGEGIIDRVITAEQAGAYKPDRRLFEYAWRQFGVERSATCHLCASPQLDHAAARDLGFRCLWVDRGTGRPPLDDYAPDLTVRTLDEVPEAFRSLGWLGREEH